MKHRSRKKGLLQECELIPITDPAEIAALERRIKAAEKIIAAREGRQPKTVKTKPEKYVPPRLVTCELVEITDPTEIAELERRVRAAEKAMADREIAASGKGRRPKMRKRT